MQNKLHTAPKQVAEQLFESIPELFPGIDRVVMLHSADEGLLGKELVYSASGYRIRDLLLQGFEDKHSDFAKEVAGYNWINKDDLPFVRENTSINKELHLFTEQQNVVLQLRLARLDKKRDIFYIYFREDQSNFGISRLQGSLDTGRKALVGTIVFRFATILYKSLDASLSYITRFTNVTRELFANTSMQSNSAPINTWVEQWASDYLCELSVTVNKKLSLSKAAINKLAGMNSFVSAKKSLLSAAQFALMLYANDLNEVIVIEDSFIRVLDDKKEIQIAEEKVLPVSRIAKTKQLLDKLEYAANTLHINGEDLTGNAVGKGMDKPVSAPAITDALRKHQNRIFVLLDKYPHKWPIIRNHFRPLINIVEKNREAKNTG